MLRGEQESHSVGAPPSVWRARRTVATNGLPGCVIAALALALSLARTHAQEPVFATDANGTIRVAAETYRAAVDAGGALVSLEVGGIEFLGDTPARGAAFPGREPAARVALRGQAIEARNDAVRIIYTFDATGFAVDTEGAAFRASLASAVSALVLADGSALPARQSTGDVRKLVAGEAVVALDQPFHQTHGSLWPSMLARGGKPEGPFRFRMQCGGAPAAGEVVELRPVVAVGKPPGEIAYFASDEAQRFEVAVRNLGNRTEEVALRWTLTDRYGGGRERDAGTLAPQRLAGRGEDRFEFATQVAEPGCRWMTVELLAEGKMLRKQETAFVLDAGAYLPPLTRPPDFAEFWAVRRAEWRALALDPREEEVPERSTEAAAQWRVTLTVAPERTVTLGLQAPRKPGRYLAMMGGRLGEKAERADTVVASMGHEGWPETATYTRWVSAENNNVLDCIRAMVRICDYLRTRPDVDRILVSGGSRQGALALVGAAVDPTRIGGIDSHVPTCLGISWDDPPYRGWGRAPTPPAMAAYVDPVNFAPDLTVPFFLDLGMFDGLSPAPGGLALYNHAARAPWKRLKLEPGGHGYFTSGFRRQARAELEAIARGP